ncbi:MAG: hypothetical protein ACRDZ6_08465, partial [Acidimicrobiales bacterium]
MTGLASKLGDLGPPQLPTGTRLPAGTRRPAGRLMGAASVLAATALAATALAAPALAARAPRVAAANPRTTTAPAGRTSATPTADRPSTGPFAAPDGLAVAGGSLWVANNANNSLTQVSTSTRRIQRVLRGAAYGFDHPTAVAADEGHLFVANEGGGPSRGSVTELAVRTHSLVRVIKGAPSGFRRPVSIVVDGTSLLVVGSAGSLTEIRAGSGALERLYSPVRDHLADPVAAAVV